VGFQRKKREKKKREEEGGSEFLERNLIFFRNPSGVLVLKMGRKRKERKGRGNSCPAKKAIVSAWRLRGRGRKKEKRRGVSPCAALAAA